MKKIKATLMAVVVVLAVMAFVSPVSAYSIDFVSYTDDGTDSTYTYTVTCDECDDHAISHHTVAWCNEDAVLEVWVDGVLLEEDGYPEGWDYGDFGEGVTGIKIDYLVNKGNTITVTIKLAGVYWPANIDWIIKAGDDSPPGEVWGPDHTAIPEFPTIAIPVAAILGLLFFFNHRKRKKS